MQLRWFVSTLAVNQMHCIVLSKIATTALSLTSSAKTFSWVLLPTFLRNGPRGIDSLSSKFSKFKTNWYKKYKRREKK